MFALNLADVMADPLAALPGACSDVAGNCAGRTHFVLHQTDSGVLTREKILHDYGGSKGKAHAYILKTGEVVQFWPFTQTDVFATKSEMPQTYSPLHGQRPAFPLLGKMIHVEMDYEDQGQPNAAQYQTLANLYVTACQTAGRVLTIVPHIEVDRGFKNGHDDPQNFQYDNFYGLLSGLGIDLARVPRFQQGRYWDKPTYKIPWDTDKFTWPPVLSGNPH